ncbi:hypothetical protein A3768_0300 [Ralstonia solanacearum]|nr:hypothetical protein F504_3178 [Ralstonia pseudosolanacearum FQY_4]ANH31483.1 hypothetical protein A3768_0300 [Ralstonia solanacearum]
MAPCESFGIDHHWGEVTHPRHMIAACPGGVGWRRAWRSGEYAAASSDDSTAVLRVVLNDRLQAAFSWRARCAAACRAKTWCLGAKWGCGAVW